MPVFYPQSNVQVIDLVLAADQSTSSATLLDLPGMAINFTSYEGTTLEMGCAYAFGNTSILGGTMRMAILLDGVQLVAQGISIPGLSGAVQSGSLRAQTKVAAGAHVLKLQWATTFGTARCRPAAAAGFEGARLWLNETYYQR